MGCSDDVAAPKAAEPKEVRDVPVVHVERAVEVVEEAVGGGAVVGIVEDVMVVAVPLDDGEQQEAHEEEARAKSEVLVVQELETKREEVATPKAEEVMDVPDVVEEAVRGSTAAEVEEEVTLVAAPLDAGEQQEAHKEEAGAKSEMPVVQELETNRVEVVIREAEESSRFQEKAEEVVDREAVLPTWPLGTAGEKVMADGPAAAAAAGQRATCWSCCGLFDAFTGSGR